MIAYLYQAKNKFMSFFNFSKPRMLELLNEAPIDMLAEEVTRRAKQDTNKKCHAAFAQYGFHLLPRHFYSPIPDDTDNLEKFWTEPSKMVGIDMNEGMGLEILEAIAPRYLPEFRSTLPIDRSSTQAFYLINSSYMAIDAHVYYCLIRHYKPGRIIEVGNGYSTLLAIAACDKSTVETGNRPQLISIDPNPWPMFMQGYPGLDELISKRVQDVPLDFFDTLEENDILFIDSSHVLRSGNDVHFEFLEILPRLKPGVLVHIHDISLPKPYPKVYYENQLYWNEQYLLQAFLAFNNRFEVIWPGNYLMLKYPEKMLNVFPEFQRMRQDYPMSEPTAFWMRVKTSHNDHN